MSRVIQKDNPQPIAQERVPGGIVLTNTVTKQHVFVPNDMDTPAGIRAAKKSILPAPDTAYTQPLASRTVPKPETPLPVPITPGILARKRAAENAAHAAEIKVERDRARELDDLERLSSAVAEKLGAKLQPEQPPEQPQSDDGSQYLPPGLRGSFEDFKASAEANAAEGNSNG